jgi:hypothetical protein
MRKNREFSMDAPDDRAAQRHRDFVWDKDREVKIYQHDDPAYPFHKPTCGKFLAVKLQVPGQPGFTDVKIDKAHQKNSHLVFDGTLPADITPLFVITPEAVMRRAETLFNPREACTFHEAAIAAGGRHKDDCLQPWWPDGARRLIVCPIGVIITVTYFAYKKKHGPSNYIQKFGEVSGIRPIFCVDGYGRFWFAGGNYTVTDDGIDD